MIVHKPNIMAPIDEDSYIIISLLYGLGVEIKKICMLCKIVLFGIRYYLLMNMVLFSSIIEQKVVLVSGCCICLYVSTTCVKDDSHYRSELSPSRPVSVASLCPYKIYQPTLG